MSRRIQDWIAASGEAFLRGKPQPELHLGRRGGRRTVSEGQPVTVDDEGIRRELPGGRMDEVTWGRLVEVAVGTTSAGPWQDDVFLILRGEGDSGCVVPSESAAVPALLERLTALPGFDADRLLQAMSLAEDAVFVCWRRSGKRGAPGPA